MKPMHSLKAVHGFFDRKPIVVGYKQKVDAEIVRKDYTILQLRDNITTCVQKITLWVRIIDNK